MEYTQIGRPGSLYICLTRGFEPSEFRTRGRTRTLIRRVNLLEPHPDPSKLSQIEFSPQPSTSTRPIDITDLFPWIPSPLTYFRRKKLLYFARSVHRVYKRRTQYLLYTASMISFVGFDIALSKQQTLLDPLGETLATYSRCNMLQLFPGVTDFGFRKRSLAVFRHEPPIKTLADTHDRHEIVLTPRQRTETDICRAL